MNTVLNRKWTADVIARGYTAVPDVLLSHMGQLGLTPTELVLLLQLMRYWWTADTLPFPSKRALALAMGCNEKNVQKLMKGLEARGFVIRVQRRQAADKNGSNLYCLDPLVEKLRAVVLGPAQAPTPAPVPMPMPEPVPTSEPVPMPTPVPTQKQMEPDFDEWMEMDEEEEEIPMPMPVQAPTPMQIPKPMKLPMPSMRQPSGGPLARKARFDEMMAEVRARLGKP
ncbi:MAG: regulatory protein GntR [Betaproteobacteria bacterium]|nr:regulatory protein GntR [Betaproteobacteria bacterium]